MNDKPRPDEFALIEQIFAPLAGGFAGAFNLTDDAAVITPADGEQLVTTIDSVVAGIHFPADAAGAEVAQRLLRVNLSDLAAMGARPIAYLLALNLPPALPMTWLREFAAGLAGDQAAFGVSLIGGDTTSTSGPLTAAITAMGDCPIESLLRRSTAQAGDLVYVSGTIGDAALGLQLLNGDIDGQDDPALDALVSRFRLPEPRVGLGLALRGVASACADISDGLIADLGHICAASGVGAELEVQRVPLSSGAQRLVGRDPALRDTVVTGGDDYELVFAAPVGRETDVAAAAASAGIPVARVGRLVAGAGVTALDESGAELALKAAGFRHF